MNELLVDLLPQLSYTFVFFLQYTVIAGDLAFLVPFRVV